MTLVTQILPNLVGYSNLGILTSFQGSARIVGRSNKIVCTALLMDTAGNLISSLPILKKDPSPNLLALSGSMGKGWGSGWGSSAKPERGRRCQLPVG